jgi:hypothetical protein
MEVVLLSTESPATRNTPTPFCDKGNRMTLGGGQDSLTTGTKRLSTSFGFKVVERHSGAQL